MLLPLNGTTYSRLIKRAQNNITDDRKILNGTCCSEQKLFEHRSGNK